MDPDLFASSPIGRVMPLIGGGVCFIPDPLPRHVDLAPVADQLASASLAMGELRGIGRRLPNPYLLIRPLQRVEAIASSNIEGTYTTVSDLLLFEAGAGERPPDTREVFNYVVALERSIALLADLPVSLRLMREAHQILLQGVQKHRGATIRPGEFKTEQNWIGGGRVVQDARFVPPPPAEALECLGDLERFIHDPDVWNQPSLVVSALIHYQFETIHPFPDGNGRLGRLLIPLILCEKGVLPQPLLYMSAFFERNKDEYVDQLFRLSQHGNWADWLRFFLRGVEEQSVETVQKIQRLQDLHDNYRARVQRARASALTLRLVDEVMASAIITIPRAQEVLDVTYRSAMLNVMKLVEAGILREQSAERPKFYIADEVISLVYA